MSGLSENQRLILVGIVGFILGVAVTAALFALKKDLEVGEEMSEEASSAMMQNEQMTQVEDEKPMPVVTGSIDRVVADDQNPGSVVRLTSATLSASTWVAVHEDMNGEPGNVLGAVRFNEGTSRGEIALLRPTVPGQLYYVRLYRDNGDREFNLEDDSMVVDVTKKPIQDIFSTAQ